MRRNTLSRDERLWQFVHRVDDFMDSKAARYGWSLTGAGDAVPNEFPTRDELIASLTLFRQFFLLKGEPVRVEGIIQTLRGTVTAHADLLSAVSSVEGSRDPFALPFAVTVAGRRFTPLQLSKAWLSRYVHSDKVVTELEGIDVRGWNLAAFPLGIFFRRGASVLLFLKEIILEVRRRGLTEAPTVRA